MSFWADHPKRVPHLRKARIHEGGERMAAPSPHQHPPPVPPTPHKSFFGVPVTVTTTRSVAEGTGQGEGRWLLRRSIFSRKDGGSNGISRKLLTILPKASVSKGCYIFARRRFSRRYGGQRRLPCTDTLFLRRQQCTKFFFEVPAPVADSRAQRFL